MRPKKLAHLLAGKQTTNFIWLSGDSIFRMGLGFLVTVMVARYMGPEKFGIYNFALAIIFIFSSVASLGMNGVVVREIISGKEKKGRILGSSLYLQLTGGLIASALAIVSTKILQPNEDSALIAILITVPSILFRSSDIIKYYFESILSAKNTVIAQNAGFIISSAAKLAIVYLELPSILLYACISLEAAIVAIALFIIYNRQPTERWKFSLDTSKYLFSQSWPLILSGLALMLYMRLDQIMIGSLIGNEELGVYSVPVKLSEIWYFIPIAISASLFPKAIRKKQEGNEKEYTELTQFIYDIASVTAFSIAVAISLSSHYIISTIYGSAYADGAPVAVIYAWAGVFYFVGTVSGRWYVNEGLQKYALTRNIAGLTISAALNLLLIPKFGITGAAASTLIAYVFATFLFDSISPRTRPAFRQKCKALWLPGALKRITSTVKNEIRNKS